MGGEGCHRTCPIPQGGGRGGGSVAISPKNLIVDLDARYLPFCAWSNEYSTTIVEDKARGLAR